MFNFVTFGPSYQSKTKTGLDKMNTVHNETDNYGKSLGVYKVCINKTIVNNILLEI